MPTIPPHALTIGALEAHTRLRAARFTVSHAHTLLDGYAQATRRLAIQEPIRPTLILLDLAAQEPGFPELAAPQLAAVLAQEMHEGALHPAWLIGLAADLRHDQATEAHVAGCHLIFQAPLTKDLCWGFAGLVQAPALPPHRERATRAYQRAAARVLHAVQAAQIHLWTIDDARLVLGWLTRYPLPPDMLSQLHGPETRRVLRALGGPRAAHARLHAIAEAWRTRYPLHGEILWMFLDGWERRAIVSYFVSRGLYEDSRVYFCITELPKRIARELRLAHGRTEDA
jgi:hypothetical protein